VGDFVGGFGHGFVVHAAGAFGVEAEVELIFPAEFESCLAEGVVSDLRTGEAFGQVRAVGGDFVGDDAVAHVLFVGQAEVFFRGDVAEHGGAVPADVGGADGRGDVVVGRGDVGDQRAECIERCFKAVFQFFFHVDLDHLQGDVAGAFDHDLDVVVPGLFGEFA